MGIRIILCIVALSLVAGAIFICHPKFGRTPRGSRLERIRQSPNYRNGTFCNREPTPMVLSSKSRLGVMLEFLFGRPQSIRPDHLIPVIKSDLRTIPTDRNVIIWFGHSSYLLSIDGKHILVDPVFCEAAPIGFLNKPFAATAYYAPDDMPEIDYLVITHDHWDHLDYKTIMQLKERVGKVVCPLGVGEHFERWGFTPTRLIELDWDESGIAEKEFTFHCLPARHFSGRGLRSNQTLWASFLLETPSLKVYIGGDGGYASHLGRIGTEHPDIDLAILENGQYGSNWPYIHMMPSQMVAAAQDLRARKVMTVHHMKYALSNHPWDEPLENERHMADSVSLIRPAIGEIFEL